MKPERLRMAEKQLRGLTALLSVQFILGVTLTTLVNYDPSKRNVPQTLFLSLHIAVAIALLIVAAIRFITSVRWHYLIVSSAVGILSIILSMIAGMIAASSGSGVAVFFMAMGFLAAFAAYGYSMGAISRLKQS